jgi:hypothetical protein
MMIGDIITYLATPCPRYARTMGYLDQSIALRSRHRRRRLSWQSHLERSKAVISEAAQNCSRQDRVVILGSGLLLDIPLDMLSNVFDEVVLVDIIHLPEVSKRISDYANVRLLQADITGIAEKLFEEIAHGCSKLPEGRPLIPRVDNDISLVISLNILSQLTIIPIEYIRDKTDTPEEGPIQTWSHHIRSDHLSALKELTCDVCLLSDFEFVYRDAKGNIVGHGTTVGELQLPEPDETWIWEIAPSGEIGRNVSKELRVGAWFMRRNAARTTERPA